LDSSSRAGTSGSALQVAEALLASFGLGMHVIG
jgi:hypothetical protein